MSGRWFRHYVGLTSDPKFGGVARRVRSTTDRVVFVFICLLESAAERNAGGEYAWNADAVAAITGCETNIIKRIHKELIAAGLITKTHVSKWTERQFESDSSRERVKRYRARQREKQTVSETTSDESVTLHGSDETAPEAEAEADTESENKITTLRSRGRSNHDLDRIKADLEAAAGDCFDYANSPGMLNLSPILGLIDSGFDLQAEILPVIRSKRPPRGGKVRSWAYFVDAIHEARAARRDAGLPRSRSVAAPRPLPRDPVLQAREELLLERTTQHDA